MSHQSTLIADNIDQYLQYDAEGAADAFVDRLVANGPWAAEPVPLVGGGAEEMPN